MEVIWPGPNGVKHLTVVPELPQAIRGVQWDTWGLCGTCGKAHNVSHALVVWNQLGYIHKKSCKYKVIDWPYDCAAKRDNPGAIVYECSPHGVWWWEPALTPRGKDRRRS